MKSLNRAAMTAVVALGLGLSSLPSQASSSNYSNLETGPRWEDQVADAVVARPIGIVATGAGAVIWGVSLPFSLGDPDVVVGLMEQAGFVDVQVETAQEQADQN